MRTFRHFSVLGMTTVGLCEMTFNRVGISKRATKRNDAVVNSKTA
jgi:hypothetical protein